MNTIIEEQTTINPLRPVLINVTDAGRFADIFVERPTEWIAVSNPGAGNQRFYNSVYMYMSALLCSIYA